MTKSGALAGKFRPQPARGRWARRLRLRAPIVPLLVGVLLLASCAAGPVPRPGAATVRFDHGVASGDPLADRVILWTRATTAAAEVPVEWLVARDESLRQVVRTGRARATAARDHTVKVDATGLEPGTTYYYAFRSAGAQSPIGRTRTLPSGDVDSLRFAVFSCSNWPFGFFAAYREVAARDDIDLVLHLGDYIYEYSRDDYGGDVGRLIGRQHEPPGEILTLADYRARYAQYRTDPDLQELHRRHPMIAVWDDHESANNSWREGAENHNEGEGDWWDRHAAAVEAYDEWLPIRPHQGDDLGKIYRSFRLGDLASLIMLDTRLVGRDRQLDYQEDLGDGDVETFRRDVLGNASRTILGAEQEEWLAAELEASAAAGVTWQVIGQQLLIGELLAPDLRGVDGMREGQAERLERLRRAGLPLNLDAWDGYPAARRRFAAVARRADNVVVLSGDTHNGWAFELEEPKGSEPYAIELGTPGVSSPGLERIIPVAPATLSSALRAANPHLVYANTSERGYMLLDLDRDHARVEWRYLDDVRSPRAREHCDEVVEMAATPGPGIGRLRRVGCP